MKRWVAVATVVFVILLAAAGSALGYRGHHGSRFHYGLGLQFVIPLGPIYREPNYPYPGCYYGCYPRYEYIRYVSIPMTGDDLYLLSSNTQHSLENVPSGVRVNWLNPDTAVGGYLIARPAFKNALGQDCREFERVLAQGRRVERVNGTACRQPDGHWNLIPAQP